MDTDDTGEGLCTGKRTMSANTCSNKTYPRASISVRYEVLVKGKLRDILGFG